MKNYSQFLDALGQRESSGNYSSVNEYGYLGKYQFGKLALIDAGFYKQDKHPGNTFADKYWTGKDGELDAVVVHRGGSLFLRTRPDKSLDNNLKEA